MVKKCCECQTEKDVLEFGKPTARICRECQRAVCHPDRVRVNKAGECRQCYDKNRKR